MREIALEARCEIRPRPRKVGLQGRAADQREFANKEMSGQEAATGSASPQAGILDHVHGARHRSRSPQRIGFVDVATDQWHFENAWAIGGHIPAGKNGVRGSEIEGPV